MAAGSASAGPAAHSAESEAAAEATAALQESGFGSALHTALGELRRITDDPPPVPVGAVAAWSEAQVPRSTGHFDPTPGSGPDRPSTQRRSMVAFGRGTPAGGLASLGDWWTSRWKELLPGMVVVTLVVVAFAVVLASGGRRADTSHVDTRRPIASDPSTTIAGLFTTASVPPGVPPADTGAPASDKATQSAAAAAPKESSSDGSGASSAPTKASNPPPSGSPSTTSPPVTQASPPDTTPDTTTPDTTTPGTTPDTTTPHVTTTLPDPGPQPPPSEVCARRPELC